jgi:hypothetical protein
MSWSVAATGKAPAVMTEIARQFAAQAKCVDPEEDVRQAAIAILATAITSQDAGTAIRVMASGHQSTSYPEKRVSNSLTITIEPLYQFFE